MDFPASAALWFLPFVVPICFYVAWTDLAFMKITNKAVLTLGAVYVLVGPFVLPDLVSYIWGYAYFAVALAAGMALNAVRVMGAGDSKFIAFAAPYVAPADAMVVMLLLAGVMIAALISHRIVRASKLRDLAPDWKSWARDGRFPMGLALGPTLALYLCLAALNGA